MVLVVHINPTPPCMESLVLKSFHVENVRRQVHTCQPTACTSSLMTTYHDREALIVDTVVIDWGLEKMRILFKPVIID